jgi:hypothetical protein
MSPFLTRGKLGIDYLKPIHIHHCCEYHCTLNEIRKCLENILQFKSIIMYVFCTFYFSNKVLKHLFFCICYFHCNHLNVNICNCLFII